MILITVALIRTVGVGTDEEAEAEVRQPDLGHTAGRQPSQDASLGLSTCRLSHLTPPRVSSHSFSICVDLRQGPPFPGQVAHVLRESITQFL